MRDWKRNLTAVRVSQVISACFYTVGAADSKTGAVMIHLDIILLYEILKKPLQHILSVNVRFDVML